MPARKTVRQPGREAAERKPQLRPGRGHQERCCVAVAPGRWVVEFDRGRSAETLDRARWVGWVIGLGRSGVWEVNPARWVAAERSGEGVFQPETTEHAEARRLHQGAAC